MFSRTTIHSPEPFHHSKLKPILSASVAAIALVCALNGYAQGSEREGLQKQIKHFEAATAQADPVAMAPLPAGRIWAHLGQLYEDAGRYPESENAYTHAIRLIRQVPGADADLATAIDGLGTLYMMWGDVQQSEGALQQALSIRQAKGLAPGIELSWYHLTALNLREHHFEKARDYAQRALNQIQAEPEPHAVEKMNAQLAVGIALCGLKRYPEAIAIMQTAMEEVNRAYQPGDLPVGFGSFVLGFAYWKSGDVERSSGLIKDAVQVIEKDLGWGHPVCRAAMNEYEHYLRSTHQKEEARAVGEELKEHSGIAGLGAGQESLSIEALF